MDFLIGGLAAAGASLVSNPLDVLKTRMQLQGELRSKGAHKVHYRNVFQAAVVVVQKDGLMGLQKGLVPATCMHFVRNSVRLGSYQYLITNKYVTDDKGEVVFVKTAIGSGLCGVAGAICGSPLFMIKTQLQSQAAKEIAVGHQHGHSGTYQAFKQIYTANGLKGLWRGVGGTSLRALVGSSAQLTTFAVSKDGLRSHAFFRENPLMTSFVASIIGGAFQTLMIQPFDLVSTRIYNQGVDAHGKGLLYSGIVDCFVKTFQHEGVAGFYKGIIANYMRLAPHGLCTLVFWDALKDWQTKYLGGRKT